MTAGGAVGAGPAGPAAHLQTTLQTSVAIAGKGLHTGRRVRATLHPMPADTGIVFRRVDGRFASPDIPARWDRVHDNTACTALGNASGVTVRTVEHLLAALYACDIVNARVDVCGPEIPILDGSALPLITALREGGRQPQPVPRRRLKVLKTVEHRHGKNTVRLEPAPRFEIDLSIALRAVGRQRWQGGMSPDVLAGEIALARAFGRARRVLAGIVLGRLRLLSYMRGASLGNVLAIAGDRPLNWGGFRVPDELVRHRVLDAVGDLLLLGAPPLGRFVAESTSHAMNCRLLSTFMADPEAWCWIDAASGQRPVT